jgi:hypothetical protein
MAARPDGRRDRRRGRSDPLRPPQTRGARRSVGRDLYPLGRLRRLPRRRPSRLAAGADLLASPASGISEREANALCGMAVGFRVTQQAHQPGSAYTSIRPKRSTGGLQEHLPARAGAQRIACWLRPRREQPPVNLTPDDRLDILELLALADNAATCRATAAYVVICAEDGSSTGKRASTASAKHSPTRSGRHASEGDASVHLALKAVIDWVSGRPGRPAPPPLSLSSTAERPGGAQGVCHRPTSRQNRADPAHRPRTVTNP